VTVTLTGFGGVGEIGGNAFLLEAPGLRVMLDVGKRFGAAQTMGGEDRFSPAAFERRPGWNDYFDAFQKPRAHMAAADLGALDLIPWRGALPRLYRPDLGGVSGDSPVDFALVSHAHVDHCGLIGLLRRDLPIVTSPLSLATLRSVEATGVGGWETDYTDLRVRGVLQRNKKGGLGDVRYSDDDPRVERPFVTSPQAVTHGKWALTFHAVDHSIQGAGAFVLTDGDTKVVYTGDFRRHGSDPAKTAAFLKAAAEADVLIMEGTRVSDHGRHGHGTDRESDVEHEVRALVEAHEAAGGPPFVGVGYPPRDLDRLRSLHRVAASVGRRLLISAKQAHLLSALREAGCEEAPDWRTSPHLGVLVRGGSHLLRRPGEMPIADKQRLAIDFIQVSPAEWLDLASRDLARWEFELLGGRDEYQGRDRVITQPVPFGDPHVVTAAEVARDPGGYLVSLTLFNMTDLFEVFPDRSAAGGLYIHSQTQPHNDDMEMDQFRLHRWLRAFNLNAPDHEPRRTHVSGHLAQEDIQEILETLRPKTLVPIHSERPDLTGDRYERLCRAQGLAHRAVVPRWGHPERVA
jgi:ribonuclease J